jgi:hypothetical protein
MNYFLSILGILLSFVLLKKRETVGDMIGEGAWMRHVGGVYNVVLIVALIIFFWSIAELTNTTDILFSPIRYLIPLPGI